MVRVPAEPWTVSGARRTAHQPPGLALLGGGHLFHTLAGLAGLAGLARPAESPVALQPFTSAGSCHREWPRADRHWELCEAGRGAGLGREDYGGGFPNTAPDTAGAAARVCSGDLCQGVRASLARASTLRARGAMPRAAQHPWEGGLGVLLALPPGAVSLPAALSPPGCRNGETVG